MTSLSFAAQVPLQALRHEDNAGVRHSPATAITSCLTCLFEGKQQQDLLKNEHLDLSEQLGFAHLRGDLLTLLRDEKGNMLSDHFGSFAQPAS